nr:hypothetical protein [Pseudoruegeria sp. HB172150]
MAVILVAAALGFMALIGTPVTAPDWVTKKVERRLNAEIGGGRVSVGGLEVAVDETFVPRVRLRNVGIQDGGGAEVARLNEVGIRVAAPALMRGDMEMRSLRVSGAQITVRRLSDGTFDLSFGAGGGTSGTLAGVLDLIEGAFAKEPLTHLERIIASQLTITLEDARSGRLWQVTEGRIELENAADAIRMTVTADVFNGTEDLASTVLEFATDKGSPEASLRAEFQNAAAGDIAAQSPALAFLEVLDAPISGSLEAAIGADGDLRGLEGTLNVGEGVLQPTPETRPIRIDTASARVSYDPDANRLDFETLSLQTAAARGQAQGQAFLRDFVGGWPETLVGQFHLSDVVVQPEGLFEEPVTFSEGATDFRLRIDPFSVEIGQLSLIDGERRLLTRGKVSAAQGWDVALDMSMNSVSLKRLLAMWPVALARGTRDWLEKNVSSGRLSDLSGAFRLNPEQPLGMLSLSYVFEGGTVQPIDTLPPITGAAGYSSLVGNSFTAVIEEGRMQAPLGGAIDMAGSYFTVADVTRKPGRADLTLKTDSTITAALSLLDLEPFNVLSKAELEADVAEGRARMEAAVGFDLVKRLQFEEIEFDVAGTLEGLQSDRLVKDREVRADMLDLRANPAGIAISGEGYLGQVPVNVVWSQEFGPDSGGQSRIEGTVALSEAFLDEFNIGLPAGSVTGEGVGTITVTLPRGEPPEFELVSDLNRMGLRLSAVNWAKAQNQTGRLEVAGRLGETPAIDRLEIEAPGLSASGIIDLGQDGAMERADFARVTVGGWLDGPVTLIGRGPGQSPAVRVNGGTVDLRQASFGGSGGGGGGGGGGPMSLRLDRLIVSEGIAFTGFNGEFAGGRGLQGRFNAKVNGVTPIAGSVVPTPVGSAVRLISDDAGGVLASAGVLKNVRGGSFDLTLNPTGGEGVYDGKLLVKRAKIVEAPAMTDLLNAISIVGLLDQMNSGGITMSEVEADFRLSPSRLTLLRSSGIGPSLGISLDGIYDLRSGQMDMRGVVSPVYFLNGIGQVFSRKGEGLFGFNFRMGGTAGNPDVSVNPLSILTPGMFREIFRGAPPAVTQ